MVALRQDGLRQIRGIVIKVMFARSCRLSRAVKRADDKSASADATKENAP